MSTTVQTGVPLYEPNRGFRTWHIDEIYKGPANPGKWYVPNVNDLVLEYQYGFHRVSALDITTKLVTLVPWVAPNQNNLPDQDILLGVAPGAASELFRIYINTSTVPHPLAVESSLFKYGSENDHVKLFKGTDISQSGRVISAWYDANMELVSENVPLELVVRDDVNNISQKRPRDAWTNTQLQDGEVVTMVTYNDRGVVTGVDKLLVKNTNFVRSSEVSQRYITNVAVKSPFISSADSRLLLVPINIPIEALTTTAIVYYSDGSRRELPIDGTKIRLHGLDEFIATVNGEQFPLVLSYALGPNEYSTDSIDGHVRTITRSYKARTAPVDGAYSVKLFVLPQWIDEFTGYRLNYTLYFLDRDRFYDVTTLVESGSNSPVFESLRYGVNQQLTVAIELSAVDPSLKNYRHVQTFGVALMANGLTDNTAWLISYGNNPNYVYGEVARCDVTLGSVGNHTLRIDNGYTALQDWLEHLYYRTHPLYDRTSETKAPTPSHFILSINGVNTEYPVSHWNQVLLTITAGTQGRVAIIRWVKKMVNGTTLQLGASPLRIKHVNG